MKIVVFLSIFKVIRPNKCFQKGNLFFTKLLPPEIVILRRLISQFHLISRPWVFSTFAFYDTSYWFIKLFLKILDINFWRFGHKMPPSPPPSSILALWALNLIYPLVPRNYVTFRRVISFEKTSWTPFLIKAWVCD